MKKEEKCQCAEILQNQFGGELRPVIIHLTGCPESYTTKDYDKLKWWQRLFTQNPRRIYEIHKQQTGTS